MNPLLLAIACAHTPRTDTIVTDLTQPPVVASAPEYTPPTATVHVLQNGSQVWLMHMPGLPLISVRALVRGGSAADPQDAPGIGSLADDMLLRGAGERDATAFAAEVERLALDIDVYTGSTGTVVSLDAHSDRLEDGLDLITDVMRRPRFAAEDLVRLKDLRKGDFAAAMDDAKIVANWVMMQVYYGGEHPLGHAVIGNQAATEAATMEALQASWLRRFGPDRTDFAVAGDITAEVLLPLLEERFGEWTTTGQAVAPIPAPPSRDGGPTLIFVDRPGTSQTALRVIMPAPSAQADEVHAADLGTIVLGGTFTSRLNHLLREEKGYTYGARARLTEFRNHGVLVASTNVQREVSAPALADLLSELRRFNDGINTSELSKALAARQTRMVEAMETRSSSASAMIQLIGLDRPPNSFVQDLDAARAVSIESVKTAIADSTMDHAVVIVVGDLAQIRTEIEEAVEGDWQVVEQQS